MTETEIFYQSIANKFGAQTVWNECGVYVTSLEPAVAAKEIEYFVGNLIERIIEDLCKLEVEDLLKKLGYIK